MKLFDREYPYNLYYAILHEESDAEENELREKVGYVLLRLPERERKMLLMYFSEGIRYQAIGDNFNISHQRVQYLIKNALKKMRGFSSTYILRYGVYAFCRRKIEDSDDIAVLNIRLSIQNSLKKNGYNTVGKLKDLLKNNNAEKIIGSSQDSLRIRNLGKKSYEDLMQKIERLG
ncbi:MAG: sigma-70 family RNA polymerase sigma factor [Oscillospiraceae bacterium]|jgi:DNA-binding CsgD family transcriptional regulator|nr:sigma-70 family RNA polymerase sigma factor [Oscillospiraceae bacterium]